MITGELKNKIDGLWDVFAASGIVEPLSVIEQITYHMFHGYDMDRTMLRIGAMNMMTHGIDNPVIEYRDSLSDQNTDKDKYSLVLANPSFKGSLDAETVSGDLLKVCKTKKPELLFLALFLRILKIGGRCACIVPDIIERFKHLDKEAERKRTEKSFMVSKDEIIENDYDLSFNKYKEIEYILVEYPPTSEIMANICEIEMEIGDAMDELEKLLGI